MVRLQAFLLNIVIIVYRLGPGLLGRHPTPIHLDVPIRFAPCLRRAYRFGVLIIPRGPKGHEIRPVWGCSSAGSQPNMASLVASQTSRKMRQIYDSWLEKLKYMDS